MRKSILHVGLDVHKDSIEITAADEGRDGEVRRFGKISGDLASPFMKSSGRVRSGRKADLPAFRAPTTRFF